MSDLKPGTYRMTVEVEIDEDGYLLPHDSGEMFMADWWTENGATFLNAEDCEAIERGRRNQRNEHERLIAQVQELQAKVNSLTRLHDERDAIERQRSPVSSQDTPPAPRPGCPCAACGPDTRFRVMNLCPSCGNKRCPGAANHRNTCTGSNEPGQPGSLYADVRPPSTQTGGHQ